MIKPAAMSHTDQTLTPKHRPSLGGRLSRLPRIQEAKLAPLRP